MIAFFVAWFLFNFCGFFLSACLYLHGSFFIGVFSFFISVVSFLFAWFLLYLRGFIFICVICVVSFLFACFLFYLRDFFYVCSVSLVGHHN